MSRPSGKVVTVTGPIAPSRLGVTDAHDHLFLDSPALPGEALTDVVAATNEVLEGKASGIGAIVELTPIGLGRRPDLLRQVSERTGVRIVGATGYHRDAHYPAGHWVLDAPVETLAERMIRDLEEGMHPRDWLGPEDPLDAAKAGVIKAGASYHHLSPTEARRLEAAAVASVKTGAPIVVHAETGTYGHEILDLLESHGVEPGRVILAHMDLNPDHELHAELAGRGATLGYDTVGRIKYRPDSQLLDLIDSLCSVGLLDRILLGLDLGRRSYFRSSGGGPGMRYLMTTFVPRLRRRIGDDAVERILVRNPARAFALVEP